MSSFLAMPMVILVFAGGQPHILSNITPEWCAEEKCSFEYHMSCEQVAEISKAHTYVIRDAKGQAIGASSNYNLRMYGEAECFIVEQGVSVKTMSFNFEDASKLATHGQDFNTDPARGPLGMPIRK